MKKNILVIFSLSLFLASFAVAGSTKASEEIEKCPADTTGICTYLKDSLDLNAFTKLPPDKEVLLNFRISKNNGELCPGSKLHNYVLQYPLSAGLESNVVKRGEGATTSHQFNTLNIDRVNRFQAFFYCNPTPIANPTTNQQAQGWSSPQFNIKTGASLVTTPPPTQKLYGCKAADGVYACATSMTDPAIAACAVKTEIPADKCGKKDAVTNTNSTTTPGAGTSKPSDKLYNPLPTDDLISMFLFIIKGFLAMVGVWATMFIIVGGFRMILAQGDEEAYKTAKRTITWAIMGVIIALLSFSIIAIVQNLLGTKVDTSAIQNVGTNK